MIRRPSVRQAASGAALLLAGILAAATAPAAPPAPAPVDTARVAAPPRHRVVITYFHTTQRCATCRKLEAYSREAVETAFAGELKNGTVVFQLVNYEEKGNEHFVKDYELYTKSLVLVDELNGRPVRWNRLDRIWQLVQDKPKFLKYVQDEARAYLAPRS